MSATRQLAEQLIARPSVTPADAGCMDLIAGRLAPLGFVNEIIDSGPADFRVRNLWSKRTATPAGQTTAAIKTLVFAGHTDVVPTGPLDRWSSDPFTPTERDGKLHGRGASDMKTSIAAFVVAVEELLAARPDLPLNIALLLTSDEEGPAVDGTVKVMEWLAQRGEQIDYCVVGEPSSTRRVGDTIKNGRRGSLGARLVVRGVQGHVAYPHLADNPVHRAAPALARLAAEVWDQGNAFFPATSFQISNIRAGTGATNLIPGELEVIFNLRFSTELSEAQIRQRTVAILDAHQLDYHIDWTLSGQPFLTERGALVDAAVAAIRATAGIEPELSTAGGTSDGRFIAPTGAQVVELGPVNATIHKVDECVRAADLELLTTMYRRIMEGLLLQQAR